MITKQEMKDLLKSKFMDPENCIEEESDEYPVFQGLAELPPEIEVRIHQGVGRIVSTFHDIGERLTGTAFLIGKNVLLTAAHNIYRRQAATEQHRMANSVIFIPELSNNENTLPEGIRALQYEVFEQYKDPQNKYFLRFDIAIVLLHNNHLENQLQPLNIEWSYKSWKHEQKSIHLAGYPQRSRNPQTGRYILEKNNQKIIRQQEFLFYNDTDGGFSGCPLLKLTKQEGTAANSTNLTTVGLHNGVLAKGSYGLSLNTFESPQEMIFQLIELMGINNSMPEGLNQTSNKKTKIQLAQAKKDLAQKQTEIQKLKSQMLQLKNQHKIQTQELATQFSKKVSLLQQENAQLKKQVAMFKETTERLKAYKEISEREVEEKATESSSWELKPGGEFACVQQKQNAISLEGIQQELSLKLYQNLKSRLSQQEYHYLQDSKYYEKEITNGEVEEEKTRYLDYLKQHIKPLPADHHQQLLLLIDICNNNNKIITNQYCIHPDYKNSTDFWDMNKRIDLEQFLSFNNWNHLVTLSFQCCGWFNDDDWRALVEHAGFNKISAIKEGDIEQFKSLEWINLCNLLIKTIGSNPLSEESKEVLRRLK